ncbi:hypothetical protein [Inquilinus sp. OTU3971]|uniref:hypothetical protein n=1 Tax=Inquilinus sp. OTU3971 TaxID=3043855 RepID=UPI00313BBBC0
MELEALVPRLVAAGVPDASIFVYAMPLSVTNGVLLLNGVGNVVPIDPELPGYFRGTFQVIVRCLRYQEGKALMDRILPALTVEGDAGSPVAGYQVNYIRPRHKPIVYPRSDADVLELSVSTDYNVVLL